MVVVVVGQSAVIARRRPRFLGIHRRRTRPPRLRLASRGFPGGEARGQPEIEIGRPLHLRRLGRLVGPLALRRRPGPRIREPGAGIRISELPHVRTSDLGLGGLVGRRRRSRSASPASDEEFRHRPQRTASENGLHCRLTDWPVPGPEQPDGSVDGVDGSPTGFEQERLKQRWQNTQRNKKEAKECSQQIKKRRGRSLRE